MNGFSILQEDYSKKLTLIRYPCPSPYSTVSLNHLLDRIQNCRRYPLLLDTLSIRSSSCEVEIASGFHFQFGGSSWIEPTIGKRQRKSSCTSSCHCKPHRCAPRNDNGGTGMGGVVASRFSGVSLYAVIASPLGRGNPVGSVMRDAGAMRWVALRDRWIAASLRSSQ